MADFHQRTKLFLRDVSRAAAWMMKRNVGKRHWWRWPVLTAKNSDKSIRPIFDDQTAHRIFEELKKRDLLVEFNDEVDGSNVPAYTMQYDIQGWDKAVSDGRPICGRWLKIRREWPYYLLVFVLGVLLTIVENRTVGLIDNAIGVVIKQSEDDGDTAKVKPFEQNNLSHEAKWLRLTKR